MWAQTPSGLSKINVWVDSDIDNTAKRFSGGDLLGDVWRFSIDDWGLGLPNPAAMRLANIHRSAVLRSPSRRRWRWRKSRKASRSIRWCMWGPVSVSKP